MTTAMSTPQPAAAPAAARVTMSAREQAARTRAIPILTTTAMRIITTTMQ
jgi:hypothetical protein